jgi:hypothetical protein
MERKNHYLLKIVLTILYAIFVFAMYRLKVGCVYLKFLGVKCPGCGITRACAAALHGDFKAAFKFHPMFWTLPIVYLYILADGRLFKRKIIDIGIPAVIAAGFVAVFLLRISGFIM